MSASAPPALDCCPDENELVAYLNGRADDAAQARLRAHLDGCDACRELLATWVTSEVPREPDEAALLARGTNLGRYVVLDPVGRGGMGVVYAAFDPELDRKVALKVLRADAELAASVSSARMLAEAQMLARLSHPNVVAVHDVGTYQGELFFAMEFVRGRSLRQAVAEAPSRWRRTLALYRAAGEGLAAAHAAQLVHRDFKPENALVGEDGRVRVTDFGLAHRVEGPHAAEVVGTLSYMAPEQRRGAPVDARSDQWSFCCALYEGLHGVPPQGTSSKSAGGIPSAVDAVLTRGLREEAAMRWPSMDDLLHALERAARPVSVSEAVLLGLAVLAAALLWGGYALELRAMDHTLEAAAARLTSGVEAQEELHQLKVLAALRADPVLAAFEAASNVDAALGLAPAGKTERSLAEAHELLRSADLPELRSEDLLLLVNASGRVLFNLANESELGDPVPAVPLLVAAMAGQSGAELWSPAEAAGLGVPLVPTLARRPSAPAILWVFASPIIRGNRVVGAALYGSWAEPALAQALGGQRGVSVSWRTEDGVWAGPPLGARVRAASIPLAPGLPARQPVYLSLTPTPRSVLLSAPAFLAARSVSLAVAVVLLGLLLVRLARQRGTGGTGAVLSRPRTMP